VRALGFRMHLILKLYDVTMLLGNPAPWFPNGVAGPSEITDTVLVPVWNYRPSGIPRDHNI